MRLRSDDCALISGFGVTVFMFRIQRELQVRTQHPYWPNWLAWADYLVLGAILIARRMYRTANDMPARIAASSFPMRR